MPTYTEPEIHLIMRPQLDLDALRTYVESVHGHAWIERVQSQLNCYGGITDAEALIEALGRLCYRSWDIGLNPNVTRVRTDTGDYLDNLIDSGHGAVLEHAAWTFIFQNVSRVFTHELVRHRVGVAISQESLRYVRLTDIPFRMPPDLFDGLSANAYAELEADADNLLRAMEAFQLKAARMHGLDVEGGSFDHKKKVTSAMRRLAPLGLSTSIGWTANARTLMHVIGLRTHPAAEEEMRLVFGRLHELMADESPLLFTHHPTRSA